MLVLFMLYPTCNRFTFSEYFMYLKIWYHCHCISNTNQYYSSLSWKSGYDPRPVFVGFMVDKVALGAVPLQSLSVSSHQYDSKNASFSFISLHYSSPVLPHCIQHARMKETNAVVRCAHAYQLPVPLNQPVKTDFGYHVGYVCYRYWYPFKIDQSFKSDLGYCLGCHCAVVGGT